MSNFIHIDEAELERKLFKELNKILNKSMIKSAKELTPIIQEIVKKFYFLGLPTVTTTFQALIR